MTQFYLKISTVQPSKPSLRPPYRIIRQSGCCSSQGLFPRRLGGEFHSGGQEFLFEYVSFNIFSTFKHKLAKNTICPS